MEVGDWITLGAVIVALGIGVASILHTQSLQKRERRERLLNEIIEWAVDVAKCRFEDKSTPSFQNSMQTLISIHRFLTDISDNLERQQRRGLYISKVSPIFGKNMNTAVVGLMKVVQDYIDVLDKAMYEEENILTSQVKPSDEEIERMNVFPKKIQNISKLLDDSVNKVIEEATKIKTRDIS
jgi:hypothetical protein